MNNNQFNNSMQTIKNYVDENIPTKTSQLTNDSDYATNASVDEKIASVSTEGTVDLSSYAKKTYVDERILNLGGSKTNILNENFTLHTKANAMDALPIKTHADGQDQPMHPKVLFFENRFGGYYFWMSYTPYPNGTDFMENPCIACSNDMVNWITPEGVTNPLDVGLSSSAYMSDSHLVYNYNTETLELWYRFVDSGRAEVLYRRTTKDGINWNEREQMLRSEGGILNYLSPSIIYDDNKYKMWVGTGTPSGAVKYYESNDAHSWNLIATTNLDVWHLDVIKTDLGYESVIADKQSGASISYSKSTDGITWDEKTTLLAAGVSGSWDSSRLYRGTLLKINGKYYIFYTGVNNNVWKIGLTISTEQNNIASIKGYKSGSMNIEPLSLDYLNNYTISLENTIDLLIKRIELLESGQGSTTILSIALNTKSLALYVGNTKKLSATVTPAQDSPNLVWSSDNVCVSVTQDGTVTANSVGKAVVKCASATDESVYDTCTVSVTENTVTNILKNVTFNDGLLNYETGVVMSNTNYVCSDSIDLTGIQRIKLEHVGNALDRRIVFFDSSNSFISNSRDASSSLELDVPSNATSMKISCSKTDLTSITLSSVILGDNLLTEVPDALTNQYYNATDGVIKSENNINAKLLTGVNSGTWKIVGIISGAIFDSDMTFIKSIAYNGNGSEKIIILENDNASVGLNYKTSTSDIRFYSYSAVVVGTKIFV